MINIENFRATIKDKFQSINKHFQKQVKNKNFSYINFINENNMRYNDLICGVYPMVFSDYRRVLHCLKLSWALFITFKMKNLNPIFRQRCRKKGKNNHFSYKMSSQNLLTLLFINIYTQLKVKKISDERQIIKCFKASLCLLVSVEMDQLELPEGIKIDLVPHPILNSLKLLSKDERLNLYFSFLQSKSLCQEVPESFIQETLEKHRKQLSTPHKGMDSATLRLLEEEGKIFGKVVRRFFKPNEGFFPTNKASFQFPRNVGGMKGDLVFHNRISNEMDTDHLDRPEPYVIGLFGQPGQGKSLLLNKLKNIIRPFFSGIKLTDLCYVRTSNCKHWDGYRSQPIVILDDLGQSKDGLDIQEFQTLVSCNPYILPMAKLSEKGTYFNSKVIITTSNLFFGHDLLTIYKDASGIIDSRSFWRRFHLPLHIEDQRVFTLRTNPNWISLSNLVDQKSSSQSEKLKKIILQKTEGITKPISCTGMHLQNINQSEYWKESTMEEVSKLIKLTVKNRNQFHENHRQTWTQTVVKSNQDFIDLLGKEFYQEQILPFDESSSEEEDTDNNQYPNNFYNAKNLLCCLNFDAYPPEQPLEVRVEPIVEPLKVRTITAGRGDLFCLKPLQRAMWKALGEFPQYTLTHGTQNIGEAVQRIFDQSEQNDYWISGDYTAATDSIALEASQALMRGILSQLDHAPTKRWAMKELSPHLLFYPSNSGLKPVLQQSGQLMGSFLSFPLLCLLNNCTAKFAGLKSHQYLINGDDILMRCSSDVYPLWKKTVEKFGLELSMGKNYISQRYGTVNSQLIVKNEVVSSGKQRLLDRRVQVLGECLRDLEIQLDTRSSNEVQDLFRDINRNKLSRTIRSIRVPLSHGGLSLSWGDRPSNEKSLRTEILVYLSDLFKKIKPLPGHICFPYLSVEKYQEENLEQMEKAFNEPVSNKESLEDFLEVSSIIHIKERCLKHPALRECFFNKNIEDLPPLSFLQVKHIPFYENDSKIVQQKIDSIFLDTFLNYSGDFSYEKFRERFLQTHLGISPEEITREYLFNLFDLDFPCDFLDEINLFERPKSIRFSSKIFKKKLEKELQPKDFDIPFISSIKEDILTHSNVIHDFLNERIYNFDLEMIDSFLQKELVSSEIRGFELGLLKRKENTDNSKANKNMKEI
jgi:hypothetical protein